jgi:hypothetical protein
MIPVGADLIGIERVFERVSRSNRTLRDTIRTIHEIRVALEHAMPVLDVKLANVLVSAD